MKNALDAVKANTCGSEGDAVDSSLVFFQRMDPALARDTQEKIKSVAGGGGGGIFGH